MSEPIKRKWTTIGTVAVGHNVVGLVSAGLWSSIGLVAVSLINAIGLVCIAPGSHGIGRDRWRERHGDRCVGRRHRHGRRGRWRRKQQKRDTDLVRRIQRRQMHCASPP